jgi:hypothetical protein
MPANANNKSRFKDLVGFLSLVSSLLGLFSALMDLADVREKGAALVSLAIQTAFYTGNMALYVFTSTFGFMMLSGIIYGVASGDAKPGGKRPRDPEWLFKVGAVLGIGFGIYRGFYAPPPLGHIISVLVGIGILALLLYFAYKQYLKLSGGDDDGKSGSTA